MVREDPTRGALVGVCLPAAVAAFGRARGYRGAGTCPGGTQPVLKTVRGLAGNVELGCDRVKVNGTPFFTRPTEKLDSHARSLPHVAFGSYRWEGSRQRGASREDAVTAGRYGAISRWSAGQTRTFPASVPSGAGKVTYGRLSLNHDLRRGHEDLPRM